MATYNIWTAKGTPMKEDPLYPSAKTKGGIKYKDRHPVQAKSLQELRRNLIRDNYTPGKITLVFVEGKTKYDEVGTLYILSDGRALWRANGDNTYDKWTWNDYEIHRIVDPATGKLGPLFEDLDLGYHKGINWALYSKKNKAARTIAQLRREQKIKAITPGKAAAPKNLVSTAKAKKPKKLPKDYTGFDMIHGGASDMFGPMTNVRKSICEDWGDNRPTIVKVVGDKVAGYVAVNHEKKRYLWLSSGKVCRHFNPKTGVLGKEASATLKRNFVDSVKKLTDKERR